jgi:hypothetical protein
VLHCKVTFNSFSILTSLKTQPAIEKLLNVDMVRANCDGSIILEINAVIGLALT